MVHGRRDPFFPVGNGEALAREIPGARFGPSEPAHPGLSGVLSQRKFSVPQGRTGTPGVTSHPFEEGRLARSLDQLIKDGETLLPNGGFATRCCARVHEAAFAVDKSPTALTYPSSW